MRGTNTIQSVRQLGSGSGFLQIGLTNLTLRDVGSLEGAVTEVVTREVLEAWDGDPSMKVWEECVKEAARISCVIKERNLYILALTYGLNPNTEIDDTYAAGEVVSIVNEEKYLYDVNSWAHLYGRNIIADSVTVTTNDPTPSSLDETTDPDTPKDITIDYEGGAVRRTDSSSSVDYGGGVLVSYQYTKGKTWGMHTGGTKYRQYMKVRFVYPKAAGGLEIIEYGKCFPSTECQNSFSAGNWNQREISFAACADLTQPDGQRLRKHWFENPAGDIYYVSGL
jgi:hypothetical protein